MMEGYKVFKHDWTCRGFQYEVGKTFEEDVTPSCCNREFHFCKKLNDCFKYYQFNPDNKVAKVIALGEIDEEADGSKCCTNKIKIVEEMSWEDIYEMVNIGERNLGRYNTGLNNFGDCNSGKFNRGYLRVVDRTERRQEWWDELCEMDKNSIKSLPNFDKDIFEEITGIKV